MLIHRATCGRVSGSKPPAKVDTLNSSIDSFRPQISVKNSESGMTGLTEFVRPSETEQKVHLSKGCPRTRAGACSALIYDSPELIRCHCRCITRVRARARSVVIMCMVACHVYLIYV